MKKQKLLYIELIFFIFRMLIPILASLIALLPFSWVILYVKKNIPDFFTVFLISFSIVLSPILYILLIGFIVFLIPKTPSGKHNLTSKKFLFWLCRDLTYENIVTFPYLNNIIMRLKPIRYVFMKLVGMPKIRFLTFAPNVRIVDPDKVHIGEFTFVGINTIISGHIVRNNQLVIYDIYIGKETIIGAYCKILGGVIIGDRCMIDSSVTLNNDVHIEDRTMVLAMTSVDHFVKIGRRVRIGKNCYIGANTIIEDNVVIHDSINIAANTKISKGSVITKNNFSGSSLET